MNKDIFDDIHQYLQATYNYKDSDIFLTLYDQILLDKIIKYNIDELKIIAGSLVSESSKICQEYLIQKSQSKIAYHLLRTLVKNGTQKTFTQDNLEWIIDEGRDALKITLISEGFLLTETQVIALIENASDEVLTAIARNRSQSDKIISLISKKNNYSANLALIESDNLSIYWCLLLSKNNDEVINKRLYEYILRQIKDEKDQEALGALLSLKDSIAKNLNQKREKTP